MNDSSIKSLDNDRDFEITYLPGYSKNSYDLSDYKLAEVLSWCDSFYDQLDRIRNKLKMKKLYSFPKQNNLEKLVEFVHTANKEFEYGTKGWAEWLASRYKLPRNWVFSIEVVILTHTLPIPPDQPLGLYIPPGPLKGIKGRLIKSSIEKSYAKNYLYTPLIYFNYRTSISRIKKYLDDNKSQIDKALSQLPTKPKVGIDPLNLKIGQMAWLLKNESKYNTWRTVEAKLAEEYADLDTSSLDLSYVNLQKLADRFIKQQNKIDV